MELQLCKSQSMPKSNPSNKLNKRPLYIEVCQNCHQHHNIDPHDQKLFYQLAQEITAQLQISQIKNIKIVKNRPFKYLSKVVGNQTGYKKSKQKQKYDYLNDATNKVERFPKIGAFEVYYENFVVFSMLTSSFKVVLQKEVLKPKQTKDQNQPNTESQTVEKYDLQNQNPPFYEKQGDFCSYSELEVQVSVLAKVIVEVVRIIDSNQANVKFLQKVENVFRFLELQWQPIDCQQSLIEYMLRNTPKQKLSSVEQILEPLKELVKNQNKKINMLSSLYQSPRKIVPYTYFKKSEKQSRIKSIYQEKCPKKDNISSSRSNYSSKSKILTNTIKFNKSKKSEVKDTKISTPIPIKKLTRQVRQSLITLNLKPKGPDTKQIHTPKNNLAKTQKPQGFIIKRHYKRTSIPNIQNQNQLGQNLKQTNFDTKKSGFIYRNDLLKQKLLNNQVNLSNSRDTNLGQDFKRQSQKVGRIYQPIGFSERNCSETQNKQPFQEVSQRIFKRTKAPQNRKNIRMLKSKSKNLVRHCFSQRKSRPLSSTLASKLIGTRQINLRNSVSVSQKDIDQAARNETENQSTENQWMYGEKRQIIQVEKQPIKTDSKKNSLFQKEECVTPTKRQQKSVSKKYQKDFIQQNIRKVSMTKRVNNYGFSASLWEDLNPSKQKKTKKSFFNFRNEKSFVHERTFSSKERCELRNQEEKEGSCEKCNKRVSDFIQMYTKSKSDSIKSIKQRQKSMKSYYSKNSMNPSLGQGKSGELNQQLLIGQESNTKQEERHQSLRKTISEGIFQKIIEENEENHRDETRNYQNVSRFDQQNNEQRIVNLESYHSLSGENQEDHIFKKSQKLDYESNLITYTLGSQQDDPENNKNGQSDSYKQTAAYYNHSLFLSLEPYIKYEPAYVTLQTNYDKNTLPSEDFASLLQNKEFQGLQKLSKFSFQREEIYQQYVVKSLRQIYKLDEIKLFPSISGKARSQEFFDPEDLISLYWQEQSSLLSDVVHILTKINRKLISRLFQNVKSVNYLGYYGVWLYNLVINKFELVVVDDEFCVAQGEDFNHGQQNTFDFIFSGTLEQKSIWYMVLEKAVAKMLGGYGQIDLCSFGKLFKLLTGCQYVEFNDLGPEKLCKILNEKIFVNKKATMYATMQNSRCMEQSISQSQCSRIEKITGWNFNEKNPFLSLIHFQSSNNRIQSVTMMDFSKEFDGVTMIFFNPSFSFNQVELEAFQTSQNKRNPPKVIEILSNSFNRDNICYISVGQSQDRLNQETDIFNVSKRVSKTTLKIYREVLSYDDQQPINNKNSPRQEQQYSGDVTNYSFRYNGEITKRGDFFFEVSLKGGRNLCFVETQAENFNIGFYSEQKVDVKKLSEKQVRRVKLINGKQYQKHEESKFIKPVKTQNFNRSMKPGDLQKSITKNVEVFKQKDLNKTVNKNKLKKTGRKQDEHKLKKSRALLIDNRKFLEDETIQNAED